MKSKICSILVLFSMLTANLSAAPPNIKIIKQRVVESILHNSVDDAGVATLITTLKSDGTWPGINYEDVSNEGFEHRNHLSKRKAPLNWP